MLIDIVKKINKVAPDTREILLDILNEIEEQRKQFENQVTKVEFNELKDIVKSLAKAQEKTEKRLDNLTNEVKQLAEAQRKTEEVVKGLVRDMADVKTRLNGLSDTVGYGLEDKLMPFMFDFVKNRYGYTVKLVDRRNIKYPNGKFDEINIYIEAEADNKKYLMLGECKAKPGKKDVKRFIKLKDRVSKYFPEKEVKGFIVGYNFHPKVEEYLKEINEIDYFKTFEIEQIAKKSRF